MKTRDELIKMITELPEGVVEQLYNQVKKATCSHKNIKTPSKRDLAEDSGSAVCDDCSANLGWYCKESPDHTCYYETEQDSKGSYVQIGSQKHYMDSNHNPEYETDDDCLFCHQPDERK